MKANHNFLLILLIAAASAQYASAFDFEINGLCYNILNKGQVEVASCPVDNYIDPDYNANGTVPSLYTVDIPETVDYEGNSYSVIGIGKKAFFIQPYMSSVNIPKSVTYIDDLAFYGCSMLTDIKLPDNLKTIGISAFEKALIKEIYIPASVTSIGRDAFMATYQMEKVTFDNNSELTTIPVGCFSGCNMKEISLPFSIDVIEADAFGGCTSLEAVSFKDDNIKSMTAIGEYAFEYCSNLKSVGIDAKSIGREAFSNCKSLETFSTNAEYIGKEAFRYCRNLETFKTRASHIDEDAFQMVNLRKLELDNAIPRGLEKAIQNSMHKDLMIIAFNADNKDEYISYYNNIMPDRVCIDLKSDIEHMCFDISTTRYTNRNNFFSISNNSTLSVAKGLEMAIGWRPLEDMIYEYRFNDQLFDVSSILDIEKDGVPDGGQCFITPTLTSDATIFVGSKGAGINDTADVTPDRFDVFTTDGRCIGKAMTASETDKLPKGIYIVRAGNRSFKIAR